MERDDTNKAISILGCGWLGLPLAEALIKDGYQVKGSTTTESKMESLKSCGVDPFLISLKENVSEKTLNDFLQSEVLFINIPPGRKQTNHAPYLEQMKTVLKAADHSPVEKIIFISSTSVYASNNQKVTEETPLQPETRSGTILKATEELLMKNTRFQTTVLRMAGLTGPNRQPGRFLAGKKSLSNASGTVNLIHLKDCIGIIQSILKKDIWNDTFNCCCDEHPRRKEFYTHAAETQGLPAPEFLDDGEAKFKTVLNGKVKKVLSYEFEYKSPFEMV